MIGFWVRNRVRIKIRIRVRVTFNVRVFHWSNFSRSKCTLNRAPVYIIMVQIIFLNILKILWQRLQKNNCLIAIQRAVSKGSFRCQEVGISDLRHFLYKSRSTAQYTAPELDAPYTQPEEKERYNFKYFLSFSKWSTNCISSLGRQDLVTQFLVKMTFLYELVAKKLDFVLSKFYISIWKDRETVAW